MSQVSYAANLRNYHPIDYELLPKRMEKEDKKLKKELKRGQPNSTASLDTDNFN